MPKLSELLFGKKAKTKKLKTKTPEQEELLSMITEGLSKGTGPYADIFGEFDKGAFEEGVSKPAMKKFQEETLPMLQEKFIANNQILGSGAQNASAKAGANLNAELAGLMYNAQNQQKQNRLQGSQLALGTNTFENLRTQPKTGILEGALKGLLPGIGEGTGNAIANGWNSPQKTAPAIPPVMVG
jgi:hypothetical protein